MEKAAKHRAGLGGTDESDHGGVQEVQAGGVGLINGFETTTRLASVALACTCMR